MWILVIGVAVAVLLLVLVLATRGRSGAARPSDAAGSSDSTDSTDRAAGASTGVASETTPEPEPLPRAAVIVNPTKFDHVAKVRDEVRALCQETGWDEPLWLETTEDDPGSGQTKEALDAGVDVICPLGGDGTVRTVGSEMARARSEVPIGLLPGGTGNLLARNLDLPVDSLRDALAIALTGEERVIDVGVLRVNPAPMDGEGEVDDQPVDAEALAPEDTGSEELHFLVMAGMGFDADIMADAPEGLKSKVGWAAYLVSGAKHLWGSQFKAQVTTDTETFSRRTRSVIIGNCGKIQSLALMPEAQVDDGKLDALMLSPDGGIGWGAVLLRLVTAKRKGHHRVTHHTTRNITVNASRAVQVQLDGDTIGERTSISAHVLPAALRVRVASATASATPASGASKGDVAA